MKHREFLEVFRVRHQESKDTVRLVKVKNELNVENMESQLLHLKECDYEHLMKYLGFERKDNELWVLIRYTVDSIDCNGGY